MIREPNRVFEKSESEGRDLERDFAPSLFRLLMDLSVSQDKANAKDAKGARRDATLLAVG